MESTVDLQFYITIGLWAKRRRRGEGENRAVVAADAIGVTRKR